MIEHAIPEEFRQLARLTEQFVRNELLPHEQQVERLGRQVERSSSEGVLRTR